MISHLSIRNFAIIENIEADFTEGLNIITGETGSGKSIVIQAVSLALGSRADTSFIRSGKDKASVQLVCDYGGEEYIITREISSNGRNICRLNGEIVTLGQLSEICRKVADIHGQYDHQSLLDPDNHIRLLDTYRQEETAEAGEEVARAFREYLDTKRELTELVRDDEKYRREADFMKFELDEIRKADPVPGEDVQLEERISVLQNSEKIFHNLSAAYEFIAGSENSENTAAEQAVSRALNMLSDIASVSGELSELKDECEDIYYRMEELGSSIRNLRDGAVFSPDELDECIGRLEIISKLKQKYGDSIENVVKYALVLEERLDKSENFNLRKEELTASLAECRERLDVAAEKLSGIRKKSAESLEKQITEELKKLNFRDAVFRMDFSECECTQDGKDRVEFLISTNKGEDLKPLSKIASGGEMSRIMLAFKKTTGDYDEIPTMIFDEIDAGISGVTATVVGRELLDIAGNHQIICITHLPQIAAFGQSNYRISKASDGSVTTTSLEKLSEQEKIDEIARLVGGMDVTEKAIANARELVEQSR